MVTQKFSALDEYRLLGKSGLRVSPLCLGTMTFGTSWGALGSDQEESRKVFDRYLEMGGNFFDTANAYQNGDSEKALGEYISSVRSQVVVATKYSMNTARNNPIDQLYGPKTVNVANLGGNHRKSLVENLDASLKRMGTGYTDILYLHFWEFRTPRTEVMRALDDCVRSGKVMYVAVSDTPAWVICGCNTEADMRGWSRFIGLQTRYNLLDRSFEYELEPMCADMGIGCIPWGVIAEGFLAGKYTRGQATSGGRAESNARHGASDRNWTILDTVKEIAKQTDQSVVQVSINWMLQKASIVSPLIGARTVDQLEENLAALDFTLTAEQMERLDEVSEVAMDKDKRSGVAFPYSYMSQLQSVITGGKTVKMPREAYQLFTRQMGVEAAARFF